MTTDAFFGWTLLNEGDSGAEVAVNELVARIIAGMGTIISQSVTAQPSSPNNFDTYLVPATGVSGDDWPGQEGKLAFYLNGWQFITPIDGMQVWVFAEEHHIFYTGGTWTAQNGHQVLTDGTNITWDFSKGLISQVTIGGNRTIDNPVNAIDGQLACIAIIQGSGGGNTLSWGTAYLFPGGTVPALASGNGSITTYLFMSGAGFMLNIGSGSDLAAS